jgi:predicted dehydrogenase
MNKVIGTAVIGLGARGLFLASLYDHASTASTPAGFELRAVCDLNPKVLDETAQRYGNRVSYHSDMHQMLRDPNIEAVVVATNDPHHVDPTIAALRAGKHVLVEKPLCQTVEEAQRILDVARQSPGIFMIGFELRSCTVFQQMKDLLDDGRIGEVKIGHCFDNVSVGGQYYFHDHDKQKPFYKTLLLQKGSHSLDLLNWFMGSTPTKVYGTGGLDYFGQKADPELHCRQCPVAPECPYEINPQGFQLDYDAVIKVADNCVWSREMDLLDNSQLLISYANGGKATFHECHFTPDYSREFWLFGTKGKMHGYYDNPGRFLIRIEYSHVPGQRTEEWKPPHTGGSHGGGDLRLRDEFYRRIIENDRADETLTSGYYSTALAICGEESIESGMPVLIPPLSQSVNTKQ